jgi:hypothetical protein
LEVHDTGNLTEAGKFVNVRAGQAGGNISSQETSNTVTMVDGQSAVQHAERLDTAPSLS